ncbi:MAG: hypothetical protein EWV58_19765 [Microcystis aeruginosa Ma_MB_F_20061100_S19]|nr:MAG: hypothetical protein EWV59_13435 [Microcystis aeruginosa Ma_MB_F_20061100_S19D]TRU10501.1 MAG: hypothetical protein EWV60_09400 [Microcystis sp. Msp_OC_L_20101000_S702]TRU10776.1 MAG: hypothetical protein EWV58_19765 [Microcystis aeruginosa Ma_MB_F_20061100_S19]
MNRLNLKTLLRFYSNICGSSVCVMQWTGVIRDETLIETDITPTFVNCFLSRANSSIKSLAR